MALSGDLLFNLPLSLRLNLPSDLYAGLHVNLHADRSGTCFSPQISKITQGERRFVADWIIIAFAIVPAR
jgi:hypothetical protein